MNKNYIDEVLEEFDSIFITNEKFDNLINMGDSPDVYEPSGEMYPKKIKSYLKQKLNQVVANERERIVDEFALMQHYTGGSSVEPKDLRINLKEAVDIVKIIKN